MRNRALVVAMAVFLLIELMGLKFVDAGADPSDDDEIILEAMGGGPVHKVLIWQSLGSIFAKGRDS